VDPCFRCREGLRCEHAGDPDSAGSATQRPALSPRPAFEPRRARNRRKSEPQAATAKYSRQHKSRFREEPAGAARASVQLDFNGHSDALVAAR
jgi:hypothetical protein